MKDKTDELMQQYTNSYDAPSAGGEGGNAVKKKLMNEYGYSEDDLKGQKQEVLTSMLANEEVYSGDDIEKQVEDLQKAAEGLQQASKDLGLSENTLLQAASGDVSELADAVSTTLPSKIKDLEKGVQNALNDENLKPELDQIFKNYDPVEVVNNIVS
mgnify:CR=1 FL=1